MSIEDTLHRVIEAYLGTRRTRFPSKRIGARPALFVDHHGKTLQRGGLQYLIGTSPRAAGMGDRRSPAPWSTHSVTFATGSRTTGTASEIMALLGHASLTTSQASRPAAAEQRRSAAANRTYRALNTLIDVEHPER